MCDSSVGGGGEGEVGEMIDAGVRVHARVDIYGPCSGSACCGLGGPSTGQNKTSGANRICIQAVKWG